ncbi:MAG: hypothetical protein M1831_003379 [Alyxoria varia]|nr:MAG: hypothetical protein M1831_003379 [Alyxoria varia]
MGTKLDIAICGGGIGGLSASIALALDGHKVTVFEAASKLDEVQNTHSRPARIKIGSSIQLPPNATKYLQERGIQSHLSDRTVYPENLFVRRWRDGKTIAGVNWKELGKKYGGPYMHVYRADLQAALLGIAEERGVNYRLDSKVVDIDVETPAVTLKSGERSKADLVVVADGKECSGADSKLSQKLFGDERSPQLTYSGMAAYSATLEVSLLQEYPDLAWLVDIPNTNVWIGKGRSIETYTLHAHSLFRMIFHCPDPVPPEKWDEPQEAMRQKIAKDFADWDPIISILTYFLPAPTKRPLMDRPTHPYTSAPPTRQVVLLGSAAHTLPPYLSQSTAMTIEDSILLASCLQDCSSNPSEAHASDAPSTIPSALHHFSTKRASRVSAVTEASEQMGALWHMSDGEAQRQRDAESAPLGDRVWRVEEGNPYIWGNEEGRRWLYGYDAGVEGLEGL